MGKLLYSGFHTRFCPIRTIPREERHDSLPFTAAPFPSSSAAGSKSSRQGQTKTHRTSRKGRGRNSHRMGRRLELAIGRPRLHGWTHHRCGGQSRQSERAVDLHRHRWTTAHHQQRSHLRAPVQRTTSGFRGRGRCGTFQSKNRLGRNRRVQSPQLCFLWQWCLSLA